MTKGCPPPPRWLGPGGLPSTLVAPRHAGLAAGVVTARWLRAGGEGTLRGAWEGSDAGGVLGGLVGPSSLSAAPPGTGMGTASHSWAPSASRCPAWLRSCPWMSFPPLSLPQFPPSSPPASTQMGWGGHSWAQHPALPCPPPSPRGAQGARGQRGCWLAALLAPCRPPDGTAGKSHTPHRAGRERASCAAEPRRGGLGDTPELGTRGQADVAQGGSERCPCRAVTRRNFARHHPRTSGPHCMSPLAWKRGAPPSTLPTKRSPKGSLQALSRCWGLG